MMNMKTTFAAAAVAFALPFAASAATIDSDTITFDTPDYQGLYDTTLCFVGTTDSKCDQSLDVNAGDTIKLTVKNNTMADLFVTAGLTASVNPDDSFSPNAMFSFEGMSDVMLDGGEITTLIGAGMEKLLTITLGDQVKDKATIDVRFEATAVPVPAAGFLLLGGLGGLAALKRRKKA